MPLGTEYRPRPRLHSVRWRPSSPRKATQQPPPHFRGLRTQPASANRATHVYCGQTTGWIKMPLSTEVGLGTGDNVLDEDPAHHEKGHSNPPTFRPMSIVAQRANGSRRHLNNWYGSRPRSRRRCVRWDPAPPGRGLQQPPTFRPTAVAHFSTSYELGI